MSLYNQLGLSMYCKTTLKSLELTYKQAIKVLDRKPKMYHHCQILEKLELLDVENTVKYTNSILVFTILHDSSTTTFARKGT